MRMRKVFAGAVNLILCATILFQTVPIDTVSAEKVTKEVYMSEWNAHLADHTNIANLFYGMTDAEDEEGNRLYSDEFIIGFLANVEAEGNTGVVEHIFSRQHAYGFELPSGGSRIRSIYDINYLLDWPITDGDNDDIGVSRGSCGVSSVQWSYGRRINYLERLKENIGNRWDVTEYDIAETDLEMVLYELEPGRRYYNAVTEAAGDDADAEVYAEAFCDYYFKPKNADLNMSGKGESCKTRRAAAKDLWKIFNSEEMVYKTITFSF